MTLNNGFVGPGAIRKLLRLVGLPRSQPTQELPPGVSIKTIAMLERMKRKVAKQAAQSLCAGEAEPVNDFETLTIAIY